MSEYEPVHRDLAEQALLGAMLATPEAADKALSRLSDKDFYQPQNQTVFHNIRELMSGNGSVDSTMLATHMSENRQLEQVGGMDYLAQLVTSAPPSGGVEYYIQQVSDAAMLRQVGMVGQQLQQMSTVTDTSAKDVLRKSLDAVFALEESSTASDEDLKEVGPLSHDMLNRLDEMQQNPTEHGVMTGFRKIDELTNGLQPGQMVVIAGRPGMGKSTLGMDFARNAALHQGLPTVVFSLEMSGFELMQRMFAAETGVTMAAFQHPEILTEADWAKLNEKYEEVQGKPLWVDDSPIINMGTIRAKCRAQARRTGVKLVVIDYLQLMTSGRSVESRQQEVSEFSRQCKTLAKELQCPVVVLSQLNRNAEQRSDKRPELSDLRESGSIEQDADMVFLVHRPDYYDKEERPGEADVILAKHRNGPTDTFNLAFLGECSRFADMADGL